MPGGFDWYQWYPHKYNFDSVVLAMDEMQDLLYRRLLDMAWLGDGLPDDVDKIAALSRMKRSVFDAAWVEVKHCFRKQGAKLVNPYQERLRKSSLEMHKRRVEAGRKGGTSKGKTCNDPSQAEAMLEQSSSNAVASPVSVSVIVPSSVSVPVTEGVQGKPKLVPSSIAELSNIGLGVYPAGFEEIWKAHPFGLKADAARAYVETRGIRPDNPTLVAKIAALKQGKDWKDGYATNLAKWLRDHGWHSEPRLDPEEAKKAKSKSDYEEWKKYKEAQNAQA